MNGEIEDLVGRPVAATRGLGPIARVSFSDGGEAIAKSGDVAAEAAGLRWLAEPATVAVPAVLGTSERLLVTETVPEGRASPGAAEEFGRSLAGLHAAGAPAFGAPPPGGPIDAWIGDAPMRNRPGPSWPDWYAEYRVRPYVRRAVDEGALSADAAATIDEVCGRLPGLAGPPEAPARLHGDLWSGNVLWADRAWVIDPAAHGGHRETDLAMLQLFGCPHLERILAAYDEAAPLADGWRDRVPLHQLFPLLVHTVLFGGGYAAQALRACERLGSRPS